MSRKILPMNNQIVNRSVTAKKMWRVVVLVSALLASPISFSDGNVRSKFITLGTNSGPIPNSARAEPANVLIYGDSVIVVDAGDAVAWQLAKVGIALTEVDAVFLSHLHFDHTGGLFALISQRFQINAPSVLTIYGPAGTRKSVQALLTAMRTMVAGGGILTKIQGDPADKINVVEIDQHSIITLAEVVVSTSKNSHYILSEQAGETKARSLSLRFDMPDRSIVYTGDTGPSGDVIKLAQGAVLLVTEVMDAEVAMQTAHTLFAKSEPSLMQSLALKFASGALKEHFERQHLSLEEAALMAQRANVKTLVISHNAVPEKLLAATHERITKHYQGPIIFASDLQEF